MVSELSARLMRGQNYNAPTNAYQSNKLYADMNSVRSSAVVSPTNVSSGQNSDTMMSIDACTEKLHQISSHNRGKKVAFEDDRNNSTAASQGCFKRRKIDELQFAASRVKYDLAKGGLPFPSLDAKLRHHVDLEDATRAVNLVFSKSFASSPFLTNITSSNCSAAATMMDFGDLFAATHNSYGSSNSATTSNSNNGSSATISVSSSEKSSTDGDSIPARLEDALLRKEQKATATQESASQGAGSAGTAHQRRAIYDNPITIREAFENSDEARLVTLSFAPFLVVHVNPAYTGMTGLSPADILGKPFHEVIQDKTLKATTAKATSLTSLHEQVTVVQQSDKKVASTDSEEGDSTNQFRIQIAVVGPEQHNARHEDKGAFTHYMISLVEGHDSTPSVTDDDTSSEEASDVNASETSPSEESLSDDDDTAVDDINALVLPQLSSLLESTMPRMRLHCGVMG